jgi:hypothetical protein
VRLGDWEADTVIGKVHKGVLVALAERVSKKTLIADVTGQGSWRLIRWETLNYFAICPLRKAKCWVSSKSYVFEGRDFSIQEVSGRGRWHCMRLLGLLLS